MDSFKREQIKLLTEHSNTIKELIYVKKLIKILLNLSHDYYDVFTDDMKQCILKVEDFTKWVEEKYKDYNF